MASELLKIVRQIEEQYPLAGINADDSRYAWPDRWNAILTEAYAQEEADAQREDADGVTWAQAAHCSICGTAYTDYTEATRCYMVCKKYEEASDGE